MSSTAIIEQTGIGKASSLTPWSGPPPVWHREARGVECTIGAGVGRGGSREGGSSSRVVLIYAVGVLEDGVKEVGSDKSKSNSLDIQAPGISRRLLISPDQSIAPMGPIQATEKGTVVVGNKAWFGTGGGNKNHEPASS